MRRSRAVRVAVVIGVVGVSIGASVMGSGARHSIASRGVTRGEAESAPGDEFLNERVLTGKRAPSADAFKVVGQQAQQVIAQTAAQDPADANAQWQFQGPTNIDNNGGTHHDGGGRVPDLAVDPRPGHAGTVYVATAGGGVWKTTDAGATFTSVWPSSLPQAMGAIAVDRNGTVWAGTGETNPGGGSITFYGDGIYKSSDGGASWTHLTGLTDPWTIARIVVNPNNPSQVWVAVSGNLFIAGGTRGVYVTNDGGTTWSQSLATPNGTTGASDLAMSQQNPSVLYAAMWDHVRVPDHRTYTGVGSGVWKTTNGGTTWTELTSPATAPPTGLPLDNPGNGRIGLAVAPSDDKYVYVNYANDPNGVFEGWFTSTNGGGLFTHPEPANTNLDVPVTNGSYVYGWWFARTYVDPANPLHVYVTGLCLWSSTDGGQSFPTDDCEPHSDQHAMAWDPNVTNQVYLGDDGGFYTSTTNGAAGSWAPAAYQPWPQFDGLDVSEQDPSRIIGGLQDNGSQRSWNRSGTTVAPNQWNSTYGGDGQQNLINPQNQQIVYSCLQYGNCAVSTDGGNTMNEFDNTPTSLNGDPTGTFTARNVYFTPLAFDPVSPSTVYYAGDVVNVSDDNGSTWRRISQDLGGPSPGTETDPLYAGHYGAVTSISVSKTNTNIVWVGTDSGLVWMTTNAKSSPTMPTWTQVSGLPVRWVSKVLVDPADAQTVYVAFSGYRAGDNNAYVMRTNNGGTSWTNLSNNLPQATVNDLTLVNNRLYAATDTGMYVSDPSSNPVSGPAFLWRQLGSNLPNIAVTAARFTPLNSTLYVSTFGRGVWSLSLAPGPQSDVPEVSSALLLPLFGMGTAGLAGIVMRRQRRRSGGSIA